MSDQPMNGVLPSDAEAPPTAGLGESAASAPPKQWSGEPVLERGTCIVFFREAQGPSTTCHSSISRPGAGLTSGRTERARQLDADHRNARYHDGRRCVCLRPPVIDDPDKVRRVLASCRCLRQVPEHERNRVSSISFARAYGLRGAKRRDSLENVLVFTELRKLAEKPIFSLSKGQSQRLALGRCLIHDPQVLILDEPAAGLDPRARIELRELIRLMATQMNKTILISSHILTELGRSAIPPRSSKRVACCLRHYRRTGEARQRHEEGQKGQKDARDSTAGG